jgi:hypothetical protein
MVIGFLLAARLPIWSVVSSRSRSVWVLWCIRDNLTLNIIMLIIRWRRSNSGRERLRLERGDR